MVAMKRLSMLTTTSANVDAQKLASDVRQYKEDSEKVCFASIGFIVFSNFLDFF